jgi:hypothetical protein
MLKFRGLFSVLENTGCFVVSRTRGIKLIAVLHSALRARYNESLLFLA